MKDIENTKDKLLINAIVLLLVSFTNLLDFQEKILKYASSTGTIIIFCCMISVVRDHVGIVLFGKKPEKGSWFAMMAIGFMFAVIPAYVHAIFYL